MATVGVNGLTGCDDEDSGSEGYLAKTRLSTARNWNATSR